MIRDGFVPSSLELVRRRSNLISDDLELISA
jgi:hypothetical protein